MTAAAAAPVETSLSSEPVHFDPVPVFVGAKEGWTGPVLAARPTSATPVDATAYTGDKAPQGAQEGAGDASAPMALEGAVKPPAVAAPPAKGLDKPRRARMATVTKQRRVRHYELARKPKPVAQVQP